jgi:hypothetical protein
MPIINIGTKRTIANAVNFGNKIIATGNNAR